MTVNSVPLSESSYVYPGDAPSELRFNITVPAGRLWVMGDNRGDSDDSRYRLNDPGDGTIPESAVVGRAFLIIWPLSRVSDLPIPNTFEQAGLSAAAAVAAAPPATVAGGGALAGAVALTWRRRASPVPDASQVPIPRGTGSARSRFSRSGPPAQAPGVAGPGDNATPAVTGTSLAARSSTRCGRSALRKGRYAHSDRDDGTAWRERTRGARMNGDGLGSPPWGPADPVPDLKDTQAIPGLGPIPGPGGASGPAAGGPAGRWHPGRWFLG